ncbi:MAG: hypothetical protein ACLSEY_08135 [Enterocloster sp.]
MREKQIDIRQQGNSWAVPVVEWIGKRLLAYEKDEFRIRKWESFVSTKALQTFQIEGFYIDFGKKDIIEELIQEMTFRCYNKFRRKLKIL